MKRRLLLFTLLLAALPLRTLAYDFSAIAPSGQTLYYDIIGSGEVQVSHCNYDDMGELAIPASVTFGGTTYAVTGIMDAAFWECRGLTSVTIPSSITTIGIQVFSFCSGLTSIQVEAGNAVYDSRNDCNAIIETSTNTLIAGCKNTVIPNTVAFIGNDAFLGCSGLTLITIPNAVTSIGDLAFCGCSGLTLITIPNAVTSIGDDAFYGCSGLTSIQVETGNTVYDSRNDCNAIIETATNTLIAGCKNTVIPNTVITIGENAFLECSGLTSITIPNSVISIEYGAFYGCSGLTSITIPNSVIVIGTCAFGKCEGLTSVSIGASVGGICDGAFQGCSGLTSITIPSSVTYIGHFAFGDCSGLTSITIPGSVTYIGSGAFGYCGGLTSIQVEAGNAVYDSRNDCNAIIETATNTLIAGCKNTVIPNTVTTIGWSAFCGCSGLTSITIPNSVTFIGDYSFTSCIGLTSVTIGSAVDSIGNAAFAWCETLAELHCKAVVPPALGEEVFYLIGQDIPVYVPCGAADAYRAAVGWNEFTNIQEDCTEGIGDVDERDGLQVWSADGSIHVAGAEGMAVRVYDMLGRLVVSTHSSVRQAAATSSSLEEELRVPVAGVYLVKVGALPARKVVVM